ncbi:MAG: M50 family metallopeptidase [Clostridiales bacterium]|nr:M50 family metallopeptidase [Clostridiales bacterium]
MAVTLSSAWNTVYPIIIAVLFFELIIIIHEGGHFVAARLMKIKVNEFSIGMGPKVFSFTRGETKYSLRWVLFGGYCSMEGEDQESDSENSFSSKKVIQRIFVVAAGAVMNLILGFLIIVIITCSQNLVGTTTVAKLEDGAASASYGLQAGDVIKSIDGMKIYTSTDVSTGLSRSADGNVEMVVERDGENVTLNIQFDVEEEDGTQYISMDFWLLGVDKTFANVISNSAATFVSYAKMVFLSLHDLIVGRYNLSDLSGPVGAVSVVSDAVKTSSTGTLKIMALLTINVGLFNLFPVPALDGWRLFLLIGEGIFRKKLPPKWEYVINAVGLVLLLLLMVFVTFSDITKLF